MPGESAKKEAKGSQPIYKQQVRWAWSGGKCQGVFERPKWSGKGTEWKESFQHVCLHVNADAEV